MGAKFSTLIAVLVLTVCFISSIHRLKEADHYLLLARNKQVETEAYLSDMFVNPINESDISLINYLLAFYDSKLIVYVPNTACIACTIDLFQIIYGKGYTNTEVSYIFESQNMQLTNELRVKGYNQFDTVSNGAFSDSNSIILIKKEDMYPIGMLKYYEQNDVILDKFFNGAV